MAEVIPELFARYRQTRRRDTVVVPRLPVLAFAMSLSIFLALTYVLCVLFDLWVPDLAMNSTWASLLPGFVWLTWPSFFLGLIESYAYGWFAALICGPLFNLTARWLR